MLIFQKHFIFLVILIVLPVFVFADEHPRLIAHAGGAVNNATYTNSLEALDSNYEKGIRYFEIDFSYTSDKEIVAIHDWTHTYSNLFINPLGSRPTKYQFLNSKKKNDLTLLSLYEVLNWFKNKEDAYLVTDFKERNIHGLKMIDKKYRDFVIPQVYNYEEFYKAENIGYKKIILTLYRMNVDFYELLQFSSKNKIFAITMPIRMSKTGIALHLKRNNEVVYVHTVNIYEEFRNLISYGVYGVYTDYLNPDDLRF